MKRIVGVLLFLAFALVSLQGVVCASDFTVLADTGILNLADDQAWEKTYKTEEGKFKVRFRKLWNSSPKKRFHLIIWWDGKRIADGYCPKNDSGYSFHIYEEKESKRIFVALETALRVVLMGYEPWNGRLEKYIDSKAYYSSGPYPKLHLDRDGDLLLTFSNERWQRCNEYKMTWNEDARWFGYRDMAAGSARDSYEESEYESDEPESPTSDATEAQPSTAPAPIKADASVMEDELYYTETATISTQ